MHMHETRALSVGMSKSCHRVAKRSESFWASEASIQCTQVLLTVKCLRSGQ